MNIVFSQLARADAVALETSAALPQQGDAASVFAELLRALSVPPVLSVPPAPSPRAVAAVEAEEESVENAEAAAPKSETTDEAASSGMESGVVQGASRPETVSAVPSPLPLAVPTGSAHVPEPSSASSSPQGGIPVSAPVEILADRGHERIASRYPSTIAQEPPSLGAGYPELGTNVALHTDAGAPSDSESLRVRSSVPEGAPAAPAVSRGEVALADEVVEPVRPAPLDRAATPAPAGTGGLMGIGSTIPEVAPRAMVAPEPSVTSPAASVAMEDQVPEAQGSQTQTERPAPQPQTPAGAPRGADVAVPEPSASAESGATQPGPLRVAGTSPQIQIPQGRLHAARMVPEASARPAAEPTVAATVVTRETLPGPSVAPASAPTPPPAVSGVAEAAAPSMPPASMVQTVARVPSGADIASPSPPMSAPLPAEWAVVADSPEASPAPTAAPEPVRQAVAPMPERAGAPVSTPIAASTEVLAAVPAAPVAARREAVRPISAVSVGEFPDAQGSSQTPSVTVQESDAEGAPPAGQDRAANASIVMARTRASLPPVEEAPVPMPSMRGSTHASAASSPAGETVGVPEEASPLPRQVVEGAPPSASIAAPRPLVQQLESEVADAPESVVFRAVTPEQIEGAAMREPTSRPGVRHVAPPANPLDTGVEGAPRFAPGSVEAPQTPRSAATVSGRVVESGAPQLPTLDTLGTYTVRSVQYLLARGESSMTVRLVPASLGEVRFEVHGSGDNVRIRMASANPAVRDAIEQQLPLLRQALAQEGIEVSRVDVTPRMSLGAEPGGHAGGRQAEHQGASLPGRPGGSAGYTSGNGPGPGSRQHRSTLHAGTLDVFA